VQLRIPGPTPLPDAVREALSRDMINHRGPEFAALLRDVTARLKPWFGTQNDLLTLTASGTGGLEAAIVNTLSPGDRVLGVTIGAFGDRFAEIAAAYGADVARLGFPPGKAAEPDAIARALREQGPFKAVLITHNETSTGVTNDLAAIGDVVRPSGALLLADGVSSVGSIPMRADAWGVDVVVSGSQKGWMVPPGLAFVTISPRAWEAYGTSRMPRFYFDLRQHQRYLERGQTPATPAVSIFYGLQVALGMLEAEGMENVFERHVRCARLVRAGARRLGMGLLADEAHASNTVTAVYPPSGVDVKGLLGRLRDRGIVLASGQGALSGKIFRIGHLGYVDESDVEEVISAIEAVLPSVVSVG
jgi:aspartate aminotransferase-like enzyme